MLLNKLKTISKHFLSRTILNIFFILCMPIIIILLFFYINNKYHLNNYKALIISNYSSKLNSFLKDTENDMNTIIRSVDYLQVDPSMMFVLTTSVKPNSDDFRYTTSAAATLRLLKNSSPIIDSVAIYNQTAEFVLTNSGLYNAQEYFEEICHYKQYPHEFWKNYRSIAKSIKIASPSPLINSKSAVTKIMIPMIFKSAGNTYSNSIIIFNINVRTIFNNFSVYKLTPNTSIHMIDNATNTYFSESMRETPYIDPKIINTISSSPYSYSNNIRINNKKYLAITSQKRFSLWGYTYMVIVPYSDIESSITKILLTASILFLILFAVLLLFALWGTKKLYQPWENLASLIDSIGSKTGVYPSNIRDYVKKSITDIVRTNETLKQDLSVILPLSQEKYLIDILNNTCEETNEELHEISFNYDYFISISISVDISDSFLLSIPDINPAQITKKVYNAIRSIFASYYVTFSLPSTNNILYLLLNLENDICSDEIITIIEKIKNMFAIDADNIAIAFGIGNIYKGIDGLKSTHQEAVANILKSLNSKKVQISDKRSAEYHFPLNQEGLLINSLLAGYTEKVTEFLNEVFKNVSKNTPKGKQQVYTDIITTLYKVMRIKNIQLNDSPNNDLEILNEIVARPENEIQLHIFSIVDTISEHMKVSNTKINIIEIIDYINDHFTEDIYLEQIAEKYNTSPKYLSKRIKQYLDVSFKDYLTQLRIDKASELLKCADVKVTDVYQKVGYYNRGAFIRAFKLKLGLTPSEYKNLHCKNSG